MGMGRIAICVMSRCQSRKQGLIFDGYGHFDRYCTALGLHGRRFLREKHDTSKRGLYLRPADGNVFLAFSGALLKILFFSWSLSAMI